MVVTNKATVANWWYCLSLGTPQRKRIAQHRQHELHSWIQGYLAEEPSAGSTLQTIRVELPASVVLLDADAKELVFITAADA